MNSNLYIEISPRATGKSYRLVRNMIEYLNKTDENVYICSTRNYSVRLIIKNLNIPKPLSKRIRYIEKDKGITGRIYYDEFLYNPNLKEVNLNGYYVSTARLTDYPLDESSFFAKLLRANGNKFQTYIHHPNVFDIDDFNKYKNENGGDVELLNRIFK